MASASVSGPASELWAAAPAACIAQPTRTTPIRHTWRSTRRWRIKILLLVSSEPETDRECRRERANPSKIRELDSGIHGEFVKTPILTQMSGWLVDQAGNRSGVMVRDPQGSRYRPDLPDRPDRPDRPDARALKIAFGSFASTPIGPSTT